MLRRVLIRLGADPRHRQAGRDVSRCLSPLSYEGIGEWQSRRMKLAGQFSKGRNTAVGTCLGAV